MRIARKEIKKVTVIGYGMTGRALTSYLHNHGLSVFVSENGDLKKADEDNLSESGISYEQGGHSLRCLEAADMIVLSPGVRPDIPILQEARRRRITILSEIDFAWLLLTDWNKLIAVTGTNGKTTTVSIIEGILKQAGINAKAVGNIGTPLISVVDNSPDVIVLEVSSFQLVQSRLFHPYVACLLNISPDHLDWHETMDNYIAAKSSIYLRQGISDVAILRRKLPIPTENLIARKVYIEDISLPRGDLFEKLAPHNLCNLRAAIACCKEVVPGLDVEAIRLEELDHLFHLPYRLQQEPSIEGIRIINDSKSTNAASSITALESVPGRCVLILGGKHKQGGYADLANAIIRYDVRHVALFGEGASFIESIIRDTGYFRTTLCSTLDQALKCALEQAHASDTVLFSPACSSFDQYANYIERGERFSQLVSVRQRRESGFL